MTIETTSAHGELAQKTPELPMVTGGDMPGLAVLQQWADANDQAARLVAQWVWTDLVPLHHWPNPAGMTLKTWPNPRMSPNGESDQDYRRRAEIATASAAGTVLRGISLGLSPNIALEQMFSIHGKIGMMTKLKYSLAIKHGVKVWDVELTPESVTCAGIHPLTGDTVEITITMDQAVKAEWAQDNKAYSKTPIDMLWARAMTRVLDRVAGHVLFGLASIEDIEPDDREPARPVKPVTAAEIQARTPPAAVEATSSTSAVPSPTAPVPTPDLSAAVELISLAQSRKLYALLRELGAGEKAAGLAVVSTLTQRPVESTKTLTAAEAGPLLDKLTTLAERPAAERRAAIEFMINPPPAELPIEGSDTGETSYA